MPKITFLQALPLVPNTRQVFGYYGLFTDAKNPQDGIVKAPYWITIQSGLGGHPDHELLHHVDATTGRGFEMRGLGNGGSHFGY